MKRPDAFQNVVDAGGGVIITPWPKSENVSNVQSKQGTSNGQCRAKPRSPLLFWDASVALNVTQETGTPS